MPYEYIDCELCFDSAAYLEESNPHTDEQNNVIGYQKTYVCECCMNVFSRYESLIDEDDNENDDDLNDDDDDEDDFLC